MKASPEIAALCRHLASAAGLADAKNPVAIDWDRWLALAYHNRVAPLLGGRLDGWLPPELPAEIRTELHAQYLREAREALLRLRRMRLLFALAAEAPGVVVLKGAALVSVLYREAAERAMVDVDLLAPSVAAAERIAARLRERGFYPGKELAGHHHLPALKDPHGSLSVELHTNLMTPLLPEPLLAGLRERSVAATFPGGARLRVLEPVDQLIHLCLHAMNDIVDAPLVRNLFEIAWCAARLTPGQQSELPVRAEAWEQGDRVARALGLAHDYFGSPQLLPRPRPGAYETWCRRRLEWLEPATLADRLQRHLANKHVDQLCAGADPHSILPLAAIAARSAVLASANRLRPTAGGQIRYAPAEVDAIPVGASLLVADRGTGFVHLLQPPLGEIFLKIKTPLSSGELKQLIAASGVIMGQVDTLATTLLEANLLLPATG